jgi:glutathione S-transferase
VSLFVLGETPVYADFALAGVLGNFLYRGWNQLSAEQHGLASFLTRLEAWRILSRIRK